MPHDRFFLDATYQRGHTVALMSTEAHHLAHVMRGKPGDTVELVNGLGQLAEATVLQIDKRQIMLEIGEVHNEPKPTVQLIIAQAMPRLNRLDVILEKGTELGMTQLWLFPGERSEKKELTDSQQRRAEAVIIASMKQCGRRYLPEIVFKPALSRWTDIPLPFFYGDVTPHAPLFGKAWRDTPHKEGAIFIIGPEAGLNEREIEIIQKMGGIGVRLHDNILRTDTAPLVALSLMQHWLLEEKVGKTHAE